MYGAETVFVYLCSVVVLFILVFGYTARAAIKYIDRSERRRFFQWYTELPPETQTNFHKAFRKISMDGYGDDVFRCDAEALATTGKALLVRLETGDELWVPQKVIHDDSEVYRKGDTGELVLKAWWARKHNLE